MAAIFPPQSQGGVPPGPGVANSYTPNNQVIGEGPLFVAPDCATKLSADQMNGLTSEHLAAVDLLGFSYQSSKVTNLGEAIVARLDAKVSIDGDTMLGPLILSGDPVTQPLQAVTKAYVDDIVVTVSNDWQAADTALEARVTAAYQAADDALESQLDGKVSRAGDAMLGLLTLAQDPTSAMDAATKQYVDSRQSFADAPSDGLTYGRKTGQWVAVLTGTEYLPKANPAAIGSLSVTYPGSPGGNAYTISPSAAPGGTVVLAASGPDANISLYNVAKGSGAHVFQNGGANQVAISGPAGADRYLNIIGAVAPANPRLFASSGRLELHDAELTGDARAVTPAPGDNDTSVATTAFVQAAVAGGAAVGGTHTGGRLTWVSATQLKFAPYVGNKIRINGTVYTIPNAGIAGLGTTGVFVNGTAGQNLAANTTYWIFAFNNGGTITADFRTSATHTPSTTVGNEGVEILTGNDSRSLIGMVFTDSATQFHDSPQNRLTLSWFNRRDLPLNGPNSGGSATSSAAFVEVLSTTRVHFVTWADEAVMLALCGSMSNNSANFQVYSAIHRDGGIGFLTGSSSGVHTPHQGSQGSWGNAACGNSAFLSEGYHYGQAMGSTTGGQAVYYMSLYGMIRG